MVEHVNRISSELGLPVKSVSATIALLEDGGTVPFIARYRKEATGALDEVAITNIRDLLGRLIELDKRRASIVSSLEERQLLTEDLAAKLSKAQTLAELEDLYLPYRPKKKTRASQAREKGLEPLAKSIFEYLASDPIKEAQKYLDAEKGVATTDDALAGARDIIAEWINEHQPTRKRMRELWGQKSFIKSSLAKGKEAEGAKYKDYFSYSEPVSSIPSHRLLAVLRGENEGILKVAIEVEEHSALNILESSFVKGASACAAQIKAAAVDSYRRLLAPSMESELRSVLKMKADAEAIKVFAGNLRELLMSSPLGEKNVLAVDPGFRTGCKIVCLNGRGDLLHHDVIYPHAEHGAKSRAEAESKVLDLIKKFSVDAIALGNGTASRESESFLRDIDYKKAALTPPPIVLVNESGASIYSASEVAREEFPNQDITVRGAVSIGRRLIDPLAELVKIDPKSIGVGQYQHDVDQRQLQQSLDDTVSSCVNSVGVELNTASKELLSYVSGLGKQLAANIVKHRQDEGPFQSREQLKKVSRLGNKAFEQCAGFLRIRNGKHPLDTTAVHPERYALVEKMAADAGCAVQDLISKAELRKKIDIKKYVTDSIGMPTLLDIMNELEKPGRDPRRQFVPMKFAEEVSSIDDLKEGMRLPGVVTNVTAFGAFVDIGVHQDGLVHISELANTFVKDPAAVVKVQQRVDVLVLSVDKERRRIALSMKR